MRKKLRHLFYAFDLKKISSADGKQCYKRRSDCKAKLAKQLKSIIRQLRSDAPTNLILTSPPPSEKPSGTSQQHLKTNYNEGQSTIPTNGTQTFNAISCEDPSQTSMSLMEMTQKGLFTAFRDQHRKLQSNNYTNNNWGKRTIDQVKNSEEAPDEPWKRFDRDKDLISKRRIDSLEFKKLLDQTQQHKSNFRKSIDDEDYFR